MKVSYSSLKKVTSFLPPEIIAILLIVALPVAGIMIASNKIGSLVVPHKADTSPSTLSTTSSPSPDSGPSPDPILGEKTQDSFKSLIDDPSPLPSSFSFPTPSPTPITQYVPLIITVRPSPSPTPTSLNLSPTQFYDPEVEDKLAKLRQTLQNIEKQPVAMNVIEGRKRRAYEDWAKNNAEVYSIIVNTRYKNDLNSILAIYGLYEYML